MRGTLASAGALGFDPAGGLRRDLRRAGALLLLLVFGVGGASALVRINGAVIAAGEIDAASGVQRIQHPVGGLVAQVRVQNGAHVKAGDILLVLDPTVSRANATITANAVDELAARQARLQSERDGLSAIRFPPELTQRAADPAVSAVMQGETRLFRLRQGARTGEAAQLLQQKGQLSQEIKGYEAESASKTREIGFIDQELTGVRKLYDQHLVPLSRLTALERGAEDLHGQVAQLQASAASARGKISEIDLRIIQVTENSRTEAGGQLSDVQNQLAELREKKTAAVAALQQVDIRAPEPGVVERLAVRNVGAVVAPGQVIMDLVPESPLPRVTARVQPSDLQRVVVGRAAVVRLSALGRPSAELEGTVARVSTEAQVDERTGASFYTVEVLLPAAQASRLAAAHVTMGMPVEVFIQTPPRSLLSYVTRPLTDQLHHAFRED
ncbi:MAG TPA: HlyD family type I secretion periplasmic adaptor subunit [Caulobacteraceae bacterium]